MLRLEELRKKLGLSQNDLADKLNMTQQRISAYEKGKREPDIETIKQLSDFFEVSTDYLLGKSNIRNHEEVNMDDVDVAFADGIKGLNNANKEIIKGAIEALLAKQEQDKKNKK
ncbi:MAG: helix-turn-helix transcriptional regulator [Clostridia bacterium]|nr:helix-turn-helix transcriptional regulator [Clostridia bacterium]